MNFDFFPLILAQLLFPTENDKSSFYFMCSFFVGDLWSLISISIGEIYLLESV